MQRYLKRKDQKFKKEVEKFKRNLKKEGNTLERRPDENSNEISKI